MKVVLDTNVWVSAWLWRGLPTNLIYLARREEIQICISESLLAELENTLSYKKLQQKIQSLNLSKEQLLIGTREITSCCLIKKEQVFANELTLAIADV
ncbi:MAG: putative toxin-antitoxin system toxin component, PIN family [Pseudanabaena sp.]